MRLKIALVAVVASQAGSYLDMLLVEKRYEVQGLKRRASLFETQCIDHMHEGRHVLNPRVALHCAYLADLARPLAECAALP